MTPLKIAASAALVPSLTVGREIVTLDKTDFTEVGRLSSPWRMQDA